MGGGTGYACRVVGCKSRFKKGSDKHFFRFPKESERERRELWIQFCRKGPDFNPTPGSGICSDHFTSDLFEPKRTGRIYLRKGSIPTIYFHETLQGPQKIVVQFDPMLNQYIGDESVQMLNGIICVEDEQNIVEQRYDRLKEIKSLCRFCLLPKNQMKCVPLAKLETYDIDPNDMVNILCLESQQYDTILSNIICETCFQQLVSIDGFKRRCKKALESLVSEMNEMDMKLHYVRKEKSEEHPWFKCEVEAIDDSEGDQEIEFIEEHLNEDCSEEAAPSAYDEQSFCQNDIKTEVEVNPQMRIFELEQMDAGNYSDSDLIQDEGQNYAGDSDNNALEPYQEVKKAKHTSPTNKEQKIVYEVVNKDKIITNAEKNHYGHRIYECFFCQLKFAGKKTFKSHQCDAEKACPVKTCPQTFNKTSLYNWHITKYHGLPKVHDNYCPECKTVFCTIPQDFNRHTRECIKKSQTEVRLIECDICHIKLNSLKAYSIHKMFHDTRNLAEIKLAPGEKLTKSGVPKSLLTSARPTVCDLCGKSFKTTHTLSDHRRYIHYIKADSTYEEPDILTCDICGKQIKGKRNFSKHHRIAHIDLQLPCLVCKKVFRHRDLLNKHSIFHDESKRIHKCEMCPERKGFFNKRALKMHQAGHHFNQKNYVCPYDFCNSAYTTNQQLKQHIQNKHSGAYV